MFLANNPITNVLFADLSGTGDSIFEAERTAIGYILNWLRLIGTGLALIMLTYIAIRYMTANPHDKGELKKAFSSYIIGAVVLIGATNIIYYVEQLVEFILEGIL